MTANPYQDVIDWLHTKEGEAWSENRLGVRSDGVTTGGHSLGGFDFEDDYGFTVTVPGGLSRYGITVNAGSGSHGTVWETPAEMQAGPKLTLDVTSSSLGGTP